jgi:pimeloyl-ACP methyl ester carboxylesterase
MPFCEIHSAQIYYELLGEDHPGQAPILLIHGSTQTGNSCWGLAAQLLARSQRVIVYDCRGHGQSTNPHHSYGFKELASDAAGLVRALGYQKAHVIGHSNGGNVALVTVMEHPEVIQSAVIQAANAYVSRDLVDKEPAIFDPQRVEIENPGWRDEMIKLHGKTHGTDYWRELLRLTVQEIISEPNYSPASLALVDRPVLVIQGENDHVNAPAHHAQYIARNIPYAELWIPGQVGHNVHDDILFEWIERVLEFIGRRGSDPNEVLYRLRQDKYPDRRVEIFDLCARQADRQDNIKLTGRVLFATQSQEAAAVLQERLGIPVENQANVLLNATTPWGIVSRSVTDLRRATSNQSERVSQALLGEAVQILEEQGDWCYVRMQQDGYLGWIARSAVLQTSLDDLRAYQSACNARVIAELLPARMTEPLPFGETGQIELAGKLPFGIPVYISEWKKEQCLLILPDGSHRLVSSHGLLEKNQLPGPSPAGINFVLDLIKRFIGVPYLWGGRTPFGYDCSGLSQTFLSMLGVHIPRDADQQFQVGSPAEQPFLPGDLLFFGEQAEANSQRFAHISHVAISLGGDELIHSNGTAWGVSINSLEPESPLFRPWLRDNLFGAKRYI